MLFRPDAPQLWAVIDESVLLRAIGGRAVMRAQLEHLLNEKIPYTSAAATIKEEFIRGRTSIAVAGTHGKTSTTSMLAWALRYWLLKVTRMVSCPI